MRAFFITNQRKTEFYHAVAEAMAARGADIFWISVSPRWTHYLVAQGWKRPRILELYRFGPEWLQPYAPTPEDKERVARVEAATEVGLKSALMMDRELNGRGASAESYAYVVTREMERFILANDIHFGFGEDTWAHEIIGYAMMKMLGRRYLVPHSIRVPSQRFGFFQSVFHDALEPLERPTEEHRAIAVAAIQSVRDRGERPFYYRRNMNPHRLRKYWVEEAKLALTGVDDPRYDHSVPKLHVRTGRRIRARLYQEFSQRTVRFDPVPAPQVARPYALILLQKQPESSIDVYGKALNNQLELVRALARLLPFEWEIWIKEHPHALGDRSPADYAEMRRIPGARLVHYGEDTMALIRRAGLVASVSGTACLEAGLLGVPALTFAPMFFGKVLLRNGFDPFAADHRDMAELLLEADRLRNDPRRAQIVVDAIAELVANSVEALISDPISAPECIEPENARKVAEATIRVMTKHLAEAGHRGERQQPFGLGRSERSFGSAARSGAH